MTGQHSPKPTLCQQKSPWHLIVVSLGWIALGAIWLFVILFVLALVGILK